jgi:predicted enzyme related to lactoylglutathione lyase
VIALVRPSAAVLPDTIFGWLIQPAPEFDYNFVTTGAAGEDGMPSAPGYIGGGMTQRTKDVDRPVITIMVDDLTQALDRITAAGGTAVGEPAKVGDMGFAAYFRDCEGNLMGLWQSAAPAT